jgi:hypothetical protein
MPAPPCCIQREAGEAFALFFAVFALKHTGLHHQKWCFTHKIAHFLVFTLDKQGRGTYDISFLF